MIKIEEFAADLQQEILSRCENGESDNFREDAFTEVMIEYLTQANEVDSGIICYHKNSPRGEKLNAYNISEDGEYIDLFVSAYHNSMPPVSVPNSEVRTHFRWLQKFLNGTLAGGHTHLEESSPVFDLSQEIYARRNDLTKARFFLLTDGVAREVELEKSSIEDIEIEYHLWDLEKLYRFISSKMQREVIEVDFKNKFGGAVPCIGTPDATGEYITYLMFFPAELLAKLYGEFGPRLLERNVRSFLQAKGKINKGIRETIRNEPHRFLAYNNGISATSEKVKVEIDRSGMPGLVSARDFQVVNGGQTTASIYHAFKRDRADISNLKVQVKLTVLSEHKKIDEFVPLISKYANSQNKVNAADFSANQPFHVKLEELSRRVFAPSASGTERQTHWYYERARGAYLDDKYREGTPAKMRQFEALYPPKQKFTKTDLAKFEHSWEQFPHFVSLGAEKNFIKFTELKIENGNKPVDEEYFKRLVAKAILFKTTEKIVAAQKFGGYKANIVPYSIAWLSHHTAQRIDLDDIWQKQVLPDFLREAIEVVCVHANEHITNPPSGRRNPSEWAKREECWKEFSDKSIDLPTSFAEELITAARRNTVGRTKEPVEVPNPEEIELVKKTSPAEWFAIARWAKETNNLAPWQRSLSFSLGRLASNGRDPSWKQARQGVKIMEEARRKGFKPEGEAAQPESL